MCRVCGIRGRSAPRSETAIHDHREPEIEELCPPVVGQDRVGRLDIAMKHAPAVRGGEPTREVECDIQDLARRHRTLELVQRPALHVFGDQIRMSREVGDSIDCNNIRMLKPGNRTSLIEETRARRRVSASVYELHSYWSFE
jgi:hypothetical protein